MDLNIEALFAELDEIARSTDEHDNEQKYRELLVQYKELQEAEAEIKEKKKSIAEQCIQFHKNNNLKNYTYAEKGIQAVCYQKSTKVINENRLQALLDQAGKEWADVSKFNDFNSLWLRLSLEARRKILEILVKFDLINEVKKEMTPDNDLIRYELGVSDVNSLYDEILGQYIFRVQEVSKK